jgi:protein MpaA
VQGAGNETAVRKWCEELVAVNRSFRWKTDPCSGIRWKIGGTSVQGRPLVYAEFGPETSQNTTLILAGVHGDEVTPIYLGLKIVDWLKENQADLGTSRVVVAPLVNPDSYLNKKRTRTNARGEDVNRNFATQDWEAKAIQAWRRKYRSDPRRNPGAKPGSEPETVFQEELIRRVKPQKVLSVHAPLNFVDYDGPTETPLALSRFSKEYVRECLKLRNRLRATSGGYFPGSLGNFAGQEMGIPTLTLELPSADPAKAQQYWEIFSRGIRVMVDFTVPAYSRSGGTQPRQADG